MASYLKIVLTGIVLAITFTGSAAVGFYEESRIAAIDRIYAWPAADRLLVRSSPGTQLLDLTTAKPVWTKNQKGVIVSADNAAKYVTLIDKRDGVHLLNGQTGELLRAIQPPKKYRNSLKGLAVSPNGQLLAVGTGDFSVHLHQLPGGQAFSTITTTGKELRIAFAPNNALLAVPDTFSSISLYDTRSWRRIGQLKWDLRIGGYASRIVFSPDSRRLAALVRGEVWLWDLSSGRVIQKFPSKFVGGGTIAFSPDGKWLAASGMWPLKKGNMYAAVGIWDSTTAAPVATLTDLEEGNNSGGLHFAFSPDGQRIAIAFPHLDRGPVAVIWHWGEKPKDLNLGFKLRVNTYTARSKASGTVDVRMAVRINGEAAHEAALDNPGVREFKRSGSDTFADLSFKYPLEKVEKIQLVVLGGNDAWELRNIAFEFFKHPKQSKRYFFSVNKWFSSDQRDVRGRAIRQMEFKLSPKPIETLR